MDIKQLHKITDSAFQTHITDAVELPDLQSFLDELREKAEDVEGSDYFSEEIDVTINRHSVVGKVDHRAGSNYYVSVAIDAKNVYLSEDPTHVVLPESIDDLDIPDSLAGVVGAGSILDDDNLQRSLETYLQDKIGTDGKWLVKKVTDGNPHLEVNIEFAKDAAESAAEVKSYIQGVFKGFDGNGYDGYVSEAKDEGSSWKVKAFIYPSGVTPDVSEDDVELEKEVGPEDIGDSIAGISQVAKAVASELSKCVSKLNDVEFQDDASDIQQLLEDDGEANLSLFYEGDLEDDELYDYLDDEVTPVLEKVASKLGKKFKGWDFDGYTDGSDINFEVSKDEEISDSVHVMDSDQFEQFAMDILTKKHGTCPVTHHKYTIKGDILYMDGEEKLHLSQSVFTALQQILRVIKKAKPVKK